MDINLKDTYWEKLVGYPTEHRVDGRWLLHMKNDDRTYGSLRIVSHPDLPPGQLRSIFTYVTSMEDKSDKEIMKTVEDYQIKASELEVFSIDKEIKTETLKHEAPFKELEKLYGVKIFV